MCIISSKVKKNRNSIKKFINDNNLNLTSEEIQKILDGILIRSKINCELVRNEYELRRLLYETDVIPTSLRKYLEISYGPASTPYIQTVVPAIAKIYINKIIIENKIDILIGRNFEKGLILEDKVIKPVTLRYEICVFLKYEKIYRLGRFPVISNPILYFYNCKSN